MANILISTNKSSQQTFDDDNQTMTVEAGVIVSFDSSVAVFSDLLSSRLVNSGFILSNVRGVGLDGDFGFVQNLAGGVIQGSTEGVRTTGAHATVVNAGAIIGSAGRGVRIEDADKASVANTGTISGTLYGVLLEGGGADGEAITNSGRIACSVIAVGSFLDAGSTLTVTNNAKGIIAGSVSVGAYAGMLVLTNHGRLVGDVIDVPGLKTTIRNDGSIAGIVSLGGGDDRFDGRGGTSGKIYGIGGVDTIIGGSKADWMDGGADRDILTGGKGPDRFQFSQASDTAPGVTRDFITDFNRGQKDRIDIGDMAVDPFVFRGGQGFVGGGTPSVRFDKVNKPGTANDRTIVHGDANGDGVTDFQIELKGLITLKAVDFYL